MKKLHEINDKVIINCHNGMSFTEALALARKEVKDDTNN